MNSPLVILCAFWLDLLWGDPSWLPHPVVAIGNLIAWLEETLRRRFPATARGERAAGAVMVVIVLLVTGLAVWVVLSLALLVHPLLYWLAQVWLGFQALATYGLRESAFMVYSRLAAGDLHGAREAVGRIVGRDTAALDQTGVAKAAVETVAENASDGVVAPLLFFALGGAVLAWLYKAVNTMDSMVGYKNDRFRHFGMVAARLDDVVNFIPARLTAILFLAAARMRNLPWRNGWRVFLRDRHNHASPNSAQPEAACAGVLGVWLGGDACYGGILVAKPRIGDGGREVSAGDILRSVDLLLVAAWIAAIGSAAIAAIWNWLEVAA
ncbi:MAG: adenosylcobinamide-phosphate synthase CbiB [Planctomycetaceae bacterium]|nr:adenosylcobinamide-phosphate synthase CbiB [Planctomycetaceae bacterium]